MRARWESNGKHEGLPRPHVGQHLTDEGGVEGAGPHNTPVATNAASSRSSPGCRGRRGGGGLGGWRDRASSDTARPATVAASSGWCVAWWHGRPGTRNEPRAHPRCCCAWRPTGTHRSPCQPGVAMGPGARRESAGPRRRRSCACSRATLCAAMLPRTQPRTRVSGVRLFFVCEEEDRWRRPASSLFGRHRDRAWLLRLRPTAST